MVSRSRRRRLCDPIRVGARRVLGVVLARLRRTGEAGNPRGAITHIIAPRAASADDQRTNF